MMALKLEMLKINYLLKNVIKVFKMKEIMKIEDSFSTQKAGLIVSGVNPQFDLLPSNEIKLFIGTDVCIVMPNGKSVNANIQEIGISESLIGKKNISIALGKIMGVEQVEVGSVLYTLNKEE